MSVPADSSLLVQRLEDGDAGRMSERLKDIGLEPAQSVLHTSNISIFEYTDWRDAGVV